MAHLAERLKAELAGGELAAWRIVPEAGNEVQPIESPETDVPRVILQAEAGQYALQGTFHRCFRYECAAICVFTPSVENAQTFPSLLGKLPAALGAVLTGVEGPLVTADDRAGCYIVQTAVGSCATEVTENSYHFRQDFRLVVQF